MSTLLILYSMTWLFTGQCDGQDQVERWKIQGQPSWHISPWLDVPIVIRGIELTKVHGGRTIWWMAGNSIIEDAMLFLGPGEDHGRHIFPDGTGQPMPAKQYSKDTQYIDLHGSCEKSGGRTVSVEFFYTVYYTK